MTEHKREAMEEMLRLRRAGYEQLAAGARTVRAGPLYWTERALLGLVQALAERRLEQLGAVDARLARGRGELINEADLGDGK